MVEKESFVLVYSFSISKLGLVDERMIEEREGAIIEGQAHAQSWTSSRRRVCVTNSRVLVQVQAQEILDRPNELE